MESLWGTFRLGNVEGCDSLLGAIMLELNPGVVCKPLIPELHSSYTLHI
jgi:hypothetical protein